MKTSESIKNIAAALAKVQEKVENVKKTKQGYGYKYATLGDVIAVAKKALAAENMSFIQLPGTDENGNQTLTTRLLHSSGEWIESTMTAPDEQMAKMTKIQVRGSQITYMRRYMLAAMVGIEADEDVDGAVPQQPTKQPAKNPGQGYGKKTISDKQKGFLKSLVNRARADEAKFFAAYGATSYDDFPFDKVNEAIAALQKKIEDQKS